ncbi:PREDICTED: phorbol-12-myristate-13-acetate-induced protein 1 [Elephantulus edwardii]|uniref:phorbol-12-myristate-13-acetate-induced protein 1 n=1 Tax=Elephantulus edwardii TaxID=28737 RepID=UPI0003F0B8B4|nr:PREDICTED: phorbol-12-myristate-13-acetate-induced protein 1 [Elephantulus edwardii]
MPGRRARRGAQPSPPRTTPEHEVVLDCAVQLRRIGDKLSFRQKLLNLIYKLFHLGT